MKTITKEIATFVFLLCLLQVSAYAYTVTTINTAPYTITVNTGYVNNLDDYYSVNLNVNKYLKITYDIDIESHYDNITFATANESFTLTGTTSGYFYTNSKNGSISIRFQTDGSVNYYTSIGLYEGFTITIEEDNRFPKELTGSQFIDGDAFIKGKVGIGNNNPRGELTKMLTVEGTSAFGANMDVNGKVTIAQTDYTPNDSCAGILSLTRQSHSAQFINIARYNAAPWSLGLLTNINTFAIGMGRVSDLNFSNSYLSITDAGNVGIGMAAPAYKLDVNGDAKANTLYTVNGLSAYSVNNLNLQTNGTTRMTVLNSNGYVGIGTASPAYKLDVAGDTRISGEFRVRYSNPDAGASIALDNPAKTGVGQASTWRIYNMSGVYGNSLQFWAYDNIGCNGGLCNSRFTILDNGKVGIGTTSPQYLLDVKGEIRATKIRIENIANFPDFVFDKNYNLPSLDEVKNFIVENGHLPEIPTSAEVEKNGMSIDEIQIKLLQKIEELTLYVIQQQETIEALKDEIKRVKEK